MGMEEAMKHMKTVLILEHEEKVFDKLSCDICGAESNSDENWAQDNYEHSTTSIQLDERVTNKTGGGGYSTETVVHLCPSCFKGKLLPWLEQQGARPEVNRADW
jgi:DNA-directed RNA polymerase subunit M/transcription elongation factor TFIIS